MDYLQVCAKSFERMLNTKYHIILGRKGKLTELNILFAPTEFHHLIGLHKLHDLHLSRGNREKIFYQILDGQLSLADLKKSRYFPTIQKRIFLDQLPEPDTFFCRSFFPKEGKDYTKGQAVYTLLKKEKISLSTGTIITQYDRLKPREIPSDTESTQCNSSAPLAASVPSSHERLLP